MGLVGVSFINSIFHILKTDWVPGPVLGPRPKKLIVIGPGPLGKINTDKSEPLNLGRYSNSGIHR